MHLDMDVTVLKVTFFREALCDAPWHLRKAL